MNYLDLKIIEREIKQGNELFILRVFDRQSKRAKRIIFTKDTRTQNQNRIEELASPLRDIVKNIYGEISTSRKLADVKDYHYGEYELVKVVAESLFPKLRLVVFGAGHVGQAVGLIGSILGLDVVVVDDRPEFASRKRFPNPGITLFVGDYSKVIEGLKLGPNSAVVIVTRGHQFDESCLRGTIGLNTGYLGMIGSKRRVLSILNRLEKDGYPRNKLEKLHAPIGLRIGAKSPQEIAVAILGEIISCFNSGNLK